MLTQLSIRNFLLIEKLDMEVPPGLLVLSGETGAGKSILLDSFGLALGDRSDNGLVRPGAEQASVTLSFSVPKKHPVHAILSELECEDDEGTLLLRRVVGKDGRSKAFINDQPVAIGSLKKIGESLFDIHGQFETHGLLNRETHLDLLDQYAGLEADVIALGKLYTVWREAEKDLAAAKGDAAAAQRRAEDIMASLQELEKLKPEAGEADSLAEKRTRLQQKERIIESLQAALDSLQKDDGANEKTAHVRRILSRAAEKSPELLNPILDAINRAEDSLADTTQSLEALLHNDDFDAAALERAEERLFALRAAARKYQCQPEELPALWQRFDEQAKLLESGAGSLKKLEEQASAARNAWQKLALSLHEQREKSAKKLETAVSKELPPLKLENGRIFIQIEKLEPEQAVSTGITRVTFLASLNPGMPPAPLHKTASGGELARFMLALRICLSADGDSTLVFDEVDSGVGGATAHAVGERLSQLASKTQILVITHSPQVAARGNHHWRVEKKVVAGAASTRVSVLEGDVRREEIARMLAGNTVTEAARQAADDLLAGEEEGAPKKKRKAS